MVKGQGHNEAERTFPAEGQPVRRPSAVRPAKAKPANRRCRVEANLYFCRAERQTDKQYRPTMLRSAQMARRRL